MTGSIDFSGNSGSLEPLITQMRGVLDPALDIWLVGGVVRDQLAGRPCHDVDIILPEDAKKAARLTADALHGDFFALDETRGMYRVLFTDNGQLDMIDFSRYQAESLESDLAMRDFSVNAIAMRLHDPVECVDPMNGRQDLKDKVLRPCRADSIRNDPVRAIRAVRLSLALGLRMVPGLAGQIRETAPLLQSVSDERKRDEIFKILEEPQPASAIRLLDHVGLLARLFPDLMELKGVTQSPPHELDVWEHTLAVIAQMTSLLDLFLNPDTVLEDGGNLMLGLAAGKLGRFRDPIRRHFSGRLNPFRSRRGLCLLAALLHDIAKPACRSIGSDDRVHFYKHEIVGAREVQEIARRMAFSEVEVKALESMVSNHIRPRYLSADTLLPSRRNVFRYFRVTGETGVETCLLALADFLALTNLPPDQDDWIRELERTEVYLEGWFEKREIWVEPIRLLDGTEIMKEFDLPPGRMIGKILNRIHEAQACGEISSRVEAIELAKGIIHNPEREDENA